jgi:predicted nucleic acid-binding protein
MPFVLDASIVVAWAFSDERHPVAEAALDRLATDDGAAPFLWWFEARNALLAGERRQRLNEAGTAAFLQRLARLPIALDRAPDQGLLLDLARRHRLTVYDAAYLELANRRGLMLATLDKDLCTAATTDGIDVLAV